MKDALPLLEKLAAKLGTTVDYLWSALLRQATLAFWVDVVLAAVLIVAVIVWVKGLRHAIKNWADIERDDHEVGYCFGLSISGGLLAIFVIVLMFSLADIMAAGFNPEFWALKQVLSYLQIS